MLGGVGWLFITDTGGCPGLGWLITLFTGGFLRMLTSICGWLAGGLGPVGMVGGNWTLLGLLVWSGSVGRLTGGTDEVGGMGLGVIGLS